MNFFDILKIAIKNSENLQKNNFKNSLKGFFSYLDQLFEKELKKEDEEEKSIKNKNLDDIRLKLIPSCQKLLNATEQNIKRNIKKGKEESLQIIEEELNNRKGKLNKVDENVATAANKLQIKIEKVIKEVIEVQEKEISILKNLIENLAKENIPKLEGKEDPTLKIETNKGFKKK